MSQFAELPKSDSLPSSAIAILRELDLFAVVLDANLNPVYANRVAKRSSAFDPDRLRSPEFKRRAKRVLQSGVASSRDPHPEVPEDTARTHVLRIADNFVVVLAEDMGAANRLMNFRRDFIANVSHELKTPISAVRLLAEAVYEAADDPQLVSEFASSLIKEAQRLATLSQDIIQLSEAQSTLQPELLEPVALRDLVREEVDAHSSFAGQHRVQLRLCDDSDQQRTDVINGRGGAIASAIANVLTNAIRHSPDAAAVIVRMTHRKRHFVVSITDFGDGIAAEHLERIFERFYRVDAARSRKAGGTGLGLSIARNVLRAHGGDVTVRSEPGRGAKFTLLFPLHDLPAKKCAKRVRRARRALEQLSAANTAA